MQPLFFFVLLLLIMRFETVNTILKILQTHQLGMEFGNCIANKTL
jgi:hypothetical protein